MKRPILLDTNIASYVIKRSHPGLDRWLGRIPVTDIFISAITEAELRYGIARLPDGNKMGRLLEEFLLTVNILPWDSAAARQYGCLRASLEKRGVPLENVDTMIAAHALAIEATLVTNDKAFNRVGSLKLANWQH